MLQGQLAGHPPSPVQQGSKQGTSFPASWEHKQLLSTKAWLRPQETSTLRSCFPYLAKRRTYAFMSSPPSSHPSIPPPLDGVSAWHLWERKPVPPGWRNCFHISAHKQALKENSTLQAWSRGAKASPASWELFLGRSCHVPPTQALELRRVKQRLVYLGVLREDVVDKSFVAGTQGAAAAAHTWKRGDRDGWQGQNPQLPGKALCGMAFGGKHILGSRGRGQDTKLMTSQGFAAKKNKGRKPQLRGRELAGNQHHLT